MKCVFILSVVSVLVLTVNSLDLRGKWKEDQYKRQGLNDFLYEMGMNWFKRVYVTSASWENEQTIFQDGNNIRVNGIKGPNKEVFELHLVADNKTITQVDMGEIGGLRDATSEFTNNSLISYLKKPDEKIIDIIATRTIEPASPELMIYTLHHIPSGKSYVSYMNKQI
jgi:hypothetical protein